MTRQFLFKEHIRVAILDGMDDGIDYGRAAAIVPILGHLDVGAFFRKNEFVGVGGGNPPQAAVVGVPVQPHKIFV